MTSFKHKSEYSNRLRKVKSLQQDTQGSPTTLLKLVFHNGLHTEFISQECKATLVLSGSKFPVRSYAVQLSLPQNSDFVNFLAATCLTRLISGLF